MSHHAMDEEQLAWLQDQLQELAETRGAMPLDVAHGYLTGVVSGPRLVLPVEWMPAVLGGEEGTEPLREALMALYQDVLHELDHQHYGPIIMHKPVEQGEPLPLPYGWCQGYVTGLRLHGDEALEQAAGDEQAAAWLTPVAAFLMYEEEQLLEPPDEAAHRQASAELSLAAMGLYQWWRGGRESSPHPA